MTPQNSGMIKARKPSQFFQTMHIIFYAMITGTAVFLTVCVLQHNQNATPPDTEFAEIFTIVVPIFCIGNVAAAYFLLPYLLKTSHLQTSLFEKLQVYFRAKLIQFAMFEGAGLLAIVVYFLTAVQNFAFWYVFILCVFALNRPSANDAIEKLRLNDQEIEQIKNDQEF